MFLKYLLLTFLFILSGCFEEEGDAASGGGGLFANHKKVTNALKLTLPASKDYKAGDNLDFKFSHPFAMNVTGGPPRIELDIGGSTVFADMISGNNTKTLDCGRKSGSQPP